MIDGWEVPSLNFLKQEPTIFGLPRRQAAMAVACGGFLFLPLEMFVHVLAAVGATTIFMFLLLVVARFLYKKDPHWTRHLTSHAWPLVRYIGG